MKVVSKIGAGSGVLIVLFLAVLAYNLTQIRRLATMQEDLSRIDLGATTISLELTRLLSRLDDFTRKLYVLRDPAYAARIEDVRVAFESELEHLGALPLEGELRLEAEKLESLWRDLPLAGLSKWLLAKDPETVPVEDEESAAELLDAFRSQTTLLRQQADTVSQVVQDVISEEVRTAVEASQRVRLISIVVVVSALTLSLPILFLTLGSIRDPLKRLREGARSVASGEFDIELDESGGDEFSRVASSFNEMVRRLGEVDQMKKEFLSHVSHELKTPLVAMQETNRLLLDELPGALNDKQKRLLHLNLESSQRLAVMISKLLDLARMEERAIAYDFQPNDLGKLVQQVGESFAAAADERGILLELEEAPCDVTAICDGDRIIQVVSNLVENALKFSAEGDMVRISVKPPDQAQEADQAGDCVVIEVADTGLGVPDKHKMRIFEKFHQVAAPGASTAGVGLGLAICKLVADAHGAKLWVEDNSGSGSVFRLAIPLIEEERTWVAV